MLLVVLSLQIKLQESLAEKPNFEKILTKSILHETPKEQISPREFMVRFTEKRMCSENISHSFFVLFHAQNTRTPNLQTLSSSQIPRISSRIQNSASSTLLQTDMQL